MLAEVVHNAEQDYTVFVGEMEAAIRAEVAEIGTVPGAASQFHQVCADHARAIEELMRSPHIEDLDQVGSGATRFARDCARWDIPVSTVLRVLQRGADLTWRWWTARISEEVADPELRAAVSTRCGSLLMSHLSSGVELAVAVHNAEREMRVRGVSWHQRETVTAILDGDTPASLPEMSHRLGYEFDAWHIAFVCWDSTGTGEDWIAMEAAVQAWAREAARHSPLLVPQDSRSIWGWLSSATEPDWVNDAITPPRGSLRLALGQPGRGLDGFRRSHAEAVRTQELAGRLETSGPVLRHAELATLALLDDDLDELRSYVARALGGLAEPGERAQRLRVTVRNYLAHGENARAVALAMHFHRNTIQSRLELAAELRGRPLTTDRLALTLALEIADAFGDRVLARRPSDAKTAGA
jgi:DNA-binding PucR family transcriptional regulator